jgi:transcriptional regulator with XRE-family HTH domain
MGIFLRGIFTIIRPVGKRNIVGTRVRQARKAARPLITQTDLVARLQLLGILIDQGGVSKIESGQRPVSDIEVVALAKALRVSVSWLLEETDASPMPQYIKGETSLQ